MSSHISTGRCFSNMRKLFLHQEAVPYIHEHYLLATLKDAFKRWFPKVLEMQVLMNCVWFFSQGVQSQQGLKEENSLCMKITEGWKKCRSLVCPPSSAPFWGNAGSVEGCEMNVLGEEWIYPLGGNWLLWYLWKADAFRLDRNCTQALGNYPLEVGEGWLSIQLPASSARSPFLFWVFPLASEKLLMLWYNRRVWFILCGLYITMKYLAAAEL